MTRRTNTPNPVQLELELWEAFDADIPFRDERTNMSSPIVSISKSKRTEPRRWVSKSGLEVEVVCDPEHGMATIWDYDLVMYAISQIAQAARRGENPGRSFRFHPADYFRAIGRAPDGGSKYERLDEAINRLYGTSINLRQDGKILRRGGKMRLIDATHWERDAETNALHWIAISLPEQIYRAALSPDSILAISPDYFQLRSGLDRALYRIARRMAGTQKEGFKIGFEDARLRCGSDQDARYFRRDLRNAIKRGALPEYHLREEKNKDGEPALRMIRQDFLLVDNYVDKSVDK